VLLAWGLRLANLGNVRWRTPDEHVYAHFAQEWRESGAVGITSLIGQYRNNPQAWLYPPPTRAGMIVATGIAMDFLGGDGESAGAVLSCAASLGSVLLLALIGLRFFPPRAALCALLFYAVSPADLAISRRTWAEALLEFLCLAALYAACEITRNSRRLIWYLLLAACGSLGVAVKEAMLLPWGLLSLWVVWVVAVERRDARDAVTYIGAAVAGAALSVGWLASLAGGYGNLAAVIAGIPAANATNAYAIEFASGPPWLFPWAFWIMSPIAALLSLAGLWAAFTRNGEAQTTRWIAIYTLVTLAIAMSLPHWINLRYVAAIYGPFYLLAGLGFSRLYSLRTDWRALAAIVLIVGAAADYSRFRRVFVADQTADLSIKMLRDEHR